MGNCYCYGHGVEKDIVAANHWYEKSAEQCFAQAQFNLGLSYYKGEGVEKNLSKALLLFRKSAEQGNANAQLHVGRCLEETNASDEEIKAAFRKSAETGNPEAMCFLGEWYYYVEKDLVIGSLSMSEADKWWREATERGYYQAQYNTVESHDFKRSEEDDDKEAVKLFKLSASKGFIPAFFALGLCYNYGNGVRKNKKKALKWFKKAAKYDYAEAVYMIGEYYYNDIADKEEAISYYKRAAELGCKLASETLARILPESEASETLSRILPESEASESEAPHYDDDDYPF